MLPKKLFGKEILKPKSPLMSIQKQLEEIGKEYNEKDVQLEQKFADFHRNELEKSTQKGRQDGLNGVPSAELNDLSSFEKEVTSSYQQFIEENEGLSKKYMIQLHEKYFVKLIKEEKAITPEKTARKLRSLEEDRQEELNDLEREKQNKLKEIETRPTLEERENDLKRARRAYNDLASQPKYQTRPFIMKTWVYWTLFSFAALAEVLINISVLEVLGENYWNTVFFALLVGIAVALAGHFAGFLFRKENAKWPPIALSGLAVIIAIGTAYYRTIYLGEIEMGIETNSTVNWLYFSTVPIIVYFVVCIASYYHIDPHTYFREIKNDYMEAKNVFELLKEQLHKEKQEIIDGHETKRKEVNNKYELKEYNLEDEEDIIRGLLQEIIAHYNVILNEGKALEKFINNSYKETIHTYRDVNSSKRTEEKKPQAWSNPPPHLNLKLAHQSPLTDLPSQQTYLN